MKKALMLALILALVLSALTALAEVPDSVPDFAVTTIDGERLTLSELLAEKDLVLLNIFASWCPPCKSEFPMIEAMYEQYADRVAVIAVSVESEDTVKVLDSYRKSLGLTFDIARIADTQVRDFLNVETYPTSLFITKNGGVGYFQLGAFFMEPQLTALAERLLSKDYDGSRLTCYGILCLDEDENPLEGATVLFCTDTLCQPFTSDADGLILNYAVPGAYHLQLLSAPEGYRLDGYLDLTTDDKGGWLLLPFVREG